MKRFINQFAGLLIIILMPAILYAIYVDSAYIFNLLKIWVIALIITFATVD